MLLADKIELRPNKDQIKYIENAMGAKRHCYNHLLNHFSNPQNKWSKTNAYQFYINILRKSFEFYGEVSSRVTRNAIDDLDSAFINFFNRHKKNLKGGFPRFKRKGIKESFALRESEKFDVIKNELRIEKLKTRIKMRQPLRFEGKTKQVTITKVANKYFASILVDTNDYDPKDVDRLPSVGVDFGIKNLAILSTGKVFEPNQKLKTSLSLLKRLQRTFAKKAKGSQRWMKAKSRIAKLHFRITRQRHALLHEVSDYLTKTFDLITLEDLNVKGMLKNRRLSRALSDAGFGYLRLYIEYKAKLRNCRVVIADRFYPSTKICSSCGTRKESMKLSERVYECGVCGMKKDRDLNASINLDCYGRDTLQPDLKCA